MNTIGSLLVHLDASPRTELRLALAQQVFARCKAGALAQGSIDTLYCTTPSFADMPLAFGEGSAGALPFFQELYEQRYRDARAMFDRVNAGSAQPMVWREAGNEPVVPAMSSRALYADLMFLGQHSPDELSSLSTPFDFVEAVLIASGKPAIVVPHAWKFAPVGQEVLIAWKPGRESARAVSSALPLLQRASRIHLAVAAGNEDGDKDLERYLRAHGVEARLERHAPLSAENAGDGLLSLAADTNADLLVMGCYGHNRARELLLGGATRTVLRTMTLPVLMVH